MIRTDLPEVLPLFPLPGALLLARTRLPLQIFEPRYLVMLDDVLKSRDRLIGIIQPRPAPEGQRRLSAVGCAGRVTAFNETEDGRYVIGLTGVSRFRLGAEVGGFTPYVRAEVTWDAFSRDLGGPEEDENFDRDRFLALLTRFFSARKLATDWEELRTAPDEMLISSLSMLMPFEPEDKQALLEAPTLATRRETLQLLVEFALRGDGEGPVQ